MVDASSSEKCACKACQGYQAVVLCPTCELALTWAALFAGSAYAAWNTAEWLRGALIAASLVALYRSIVVWRTHPHHT